MIRNVFLYYLTYHFYSFLISFFCVLFLVNLSKVLVVRDGKLKTELLENLRVGQIVKVLNRESIPADLVLLGSSEPENLCYLETSNIDGENNLKMRIANSKLSFTRENQSLQGNLTCEIPNNNIYHFEGLLIVNEEEDSELEQKHKITLDKNQFLPRGSVLLNTEWIYGVIIYTGHDTKIMQNVKESPRKISKIDKLTDFQNIYIVLFLISLIFITFLGNWHYTYALLENKFSYFSVFMDTLKSQYGLDMFKEVFEVKKWVLIGMNTLKYVILMNNLIPSSLSVILEIVRMVLTSLINSDPELYDEETQLSSKAKSSNLIDDLGRIDYILTDKTGTLTCNKMNLKHVLIGRDIYKNCTEKSSLLHQNTSNSVDLFMKAMTICHTVMINKSAKAGDSEYQASSPDELAIVKAAKQLDYVFTNRSAEQVKIQFHDETAEFNLLALIEFTSDRKRMSVVVRDPQGRIFLFCKGADNVIFSRLRQEDSESVSFCSGVLEDFAVDGLRTLCFAYREISPLDYEHWLVEWTSAINTVNNRQEAIDAAAEMIETSMTLLGATGVEDKLQSGVPKAIRTLFKANIKIWMLTGDRIETAVNTGFLSGLISEDSSQLLLNDQLDLKEKMTHFLNELPKNPVLIISGTDLKHILDTDDVCKLFMKISRSCKTVICCRMSPLQKSQLTQLVKDKYGKTTLAIGDGGNDVGMIQTADIGVGINGLEGSQAARSADFSIPKFRFLVKLLLVHGSWSLYRISRVILYSMYKNFAIFVVQFWYAFFSAFSAFSISDPFHLQIFNSVFTLLPPIIIGITDQYVSAADLMKHPQLYRFGQTGKFYSTRSFWQAIWNAVLHSLIMFFGLYFFIISAPVFKDGTVLSRKDLGCLFYFVAINTVNLKALLYTNYITLYLGVSLIGASGLYFWMLKSSSSFPFVAMASSPLFWSIITIIPIITVTRDFLWKFYQRQLKPRSYHIMQELHAMEAKKKRLDKKLRKMSLSDSRRRLLSSGSISTDSENEKIVKTSGRGFSFSQSAGQGKVFSAYGHIHNLHEDNPV